MSDKLMSDRLMTPTEVSVRLGVGVGTLYSWRHLGTNLQGIKVGGSLRYVERDVEGFLLESEKQPVLSK